MHDKQFPSLLASQVDSSAKASAPGRTPAADETKVCTALTELALAVRQTPTAETRYIYDIVHELDAALRTGVCHAALLEILRDSAVTDKDAPTR